MADTIKAEGSIGKDDTELNYVQFAASAWKAADDTWRPRRVAFDESWALFWNRYDFSKKAPWQSKNFSPKMNRMVRQAAYAFKSALVGQDDYFSVEGVGQKSRDRAWVVSKLLFYWLEQNNFRSRLVDSLFASLMSSLMVFKIYWETASEEVVVAPAKTKATPRGAALLSAALMETERQPKGVLPEAPTTKTRVFGRLKVEEIDANRFRIDPTGRKKYVIHEYEMDLHDLKELAKVAANKYEKEEVEAIEEDFRKHEEEIRTKLRAGEMLTSEQNRSFRRNVVLREYWGEVFDNKGNLLGRNKTFTVANETKLVRKAMDNPYLPNELCFVWGAPLRVPFSSLHQSFAEGINGLCRIATEILNLTLDANLWASIKAFELDLDMVVDPNEFKNGVYPGKVFKKRARGVPRQMVMPLEMGSVNPGNLQLYSAVDRETQNATGVNEFAAGFVGGRKVETATEINVKGGQSQGYLNSIAEEIEENILDLVLEKCWKMIVTHQDDFSDAELKELLGDDVSDLLVFLTDEGRREYLSGKYKFLFRGMSSMLAKGKELEKVQMTVDMLEKLPGAAQHLKDGGKPLLRKFFDALDWNPAEYVDVDQMTPPPGAPSAAPPPPGAVGAPGTPPPPPGGAPMLAAAFGGGVPTATGPTSPLLAALAGAGGHR